MKLSTAAIILTGVLVGVFVGLVGTGGAFIIPVLVYLLKMGQLKAQGTALLIAAFPVWFFPFLPYYKASQFDLRTALLLSGGIALGGYLGAVLAQHLPQEVVRKAFAVGLMGLAVKMFLDH
jgi:uncharacterized membrane protein YfcA